MADTICSPIRLGRYPRWAWALPCWVIFWCGFWCGAAAAVEEPPESAVLHWRNGDSLEGVLQSADENELAWASPLFDTPLRLRLDHLHSISFPAQKPIADEVSTQTIETTDGNRLYGRVTGINGQFVSVQTQLFGSLRLRRAAARLISNPVQSPRLYSGPVGLAGWSTLTAGRKLSEWEMVRDGGLSTSIVAAELYRPLNVQGSIDIDVELQWRTRPSFQIRFLTPYAEPTEETIKLAPRTNGYVLQTSSSSGRFEQLEVLSKNTTKCRLRLSWDQRTQTLAIYRDKKPIGKMEVGGNRKPGVAGLYIKNSGRHLILSRLEINGSNTLRARTLDPATDIVLLTDDRFISGTIQRMSEDASAVVIQDQSGNERQIRWSDIAEVGFRSKAQKLPINKGRVVECVFHNGEVLRGEFSGADRTGLMLKIRAADRPVRCPLRAIARIVFNRVFTSAPSNAKRSGVPSPVMQIRIGQATLHGQLVGCGADHAIGWLPLGGVEACRLTSTKPARVILNPRRARTSNAVDEDLMYLRSGDLIPGRVRSMNERQATIETEFAGTGHVAIDALKAIELAASPLQPVLGIDDPGWESNAIENITRDQQKVTFKGPATWRNEKILHGNDVEFELNWSASQNTPPIQVKLLSGKDARRQTLVLAFTQNRLFVLQQSIGPGNRAVLPRRAMRLPTRQPLKVRISKSEGIQLSADGREPQALALNKLLPSKGWTGIEFRVAPNPQPKEAKVKINFGRRKVIPPGGVVLLRGNGQVPQGPRAASFEVTISNFQISRSRGGSGSLALALEDAEPLLTVPRSRRNNPAKHLLVGINADLVRGELLSLEEKTLRFRSRLDEMSFPRSTVVGIIWLEEEKEEKEEEEEEEEEDQEAPVSPIPPPPRIVLRNGSTISLADNRLRNGVLVGEHPELGRCRMPLEEVREILLGTIDNPSQAYSYSGWRTRPAPEPQFAEGMAGATGSHRIDSPLIGTLVKDFQAPVLGELRSFRLSRCRGRVVVLDFWATWCAPCVRSLPGLIETVEAFPADRVSLLAVNQQEDEETVNTFREAHGWQLPIALDPQGQIGQRFDVEDIPQTVIIDPDGKVAQVFVGAGPDLHEEIQATIQQLLEAR